MFKRFQLWLYTGSVLDVSEQRPALPGDFSKVLAELYIFGETHIIPGLQNAVIDSTIDQLMITGVVLINSINSFYLNTSKGSPIRQLYVEMMADGNIDLRDPKWGIEGEPPVIVYPREFLADMILSMQDRLVGKRQKRIDFTRERWRYYLPTSNGEADTKGGKSG